MIKQISKLLLCLIGISSPFIATVYLTNTPKEPNPFKETLTLKEIVKVPEEDKVFISDGKGNGDGAAVVGGDGGKSSGEAGGGGDAGTGSNPSDTADGKGEQADESTTTKGDKEKDKNDAEDKGKEQESEKQAETTEETAKTTEDSSATGPEQPPQEQSQTPAEGQSSPSGSTTSREGSDPCADIQNLIAKLTSSPSQNVSNFSEFLRIDRNVNTLSSCISKLPEDKSS
ncbi:hypothetical protein [Candidatus Mycoplasma haematohominis]|uniref:hypothetical protein n=1 Tax=Candidatus Mycoplasma haematohominis TaxID=1494318 RepID=UPI001C0A75DE|nr:hypothetical protein [Candidatus Mycoplasma haemohominis]